MVILKKHKIDWWFGSFYVFMPEWDGNFSKSQPFLKIPEKYTDKETKKYKYFINSYNDNGNILSI